MNKVVLLDSGPLGMVSNPMGSAETIECHRWLERIVSQGFPVLVPDIADYKVRRELLRAKRSKGIARLDLLKEALGYIPLTTPIMLQAAEFWAQARRLGRKTADDPSLDADMILAAQATSLQNAEDEVFIATTNPRHLELFAKARHWKDIP